MPILKPFAAYPDKHNRYTTHLHFDGVGSKRFYMRGALSWPELEDEGFAVMGGYDIHAGAVIVFEEFPYWTVKAWLTDSGELRRRDDGKGYHLGLTQFMRDNNSLYKCCSYFWGGQHNDIYRHYGRDVYGEAKMPVELIEVPYVAETGDSVLLEKIKTHKFFVQADGVLSGAISQYIARRAAGGKVSNAVRTLQCLLAGFEFIPWRDLGPG